MAYSFPEGLIPGFTINVAEAGAQRKIECSGTLDARDSTAVVQTELLRFHESLVADKVSEVRLDMRRIDYMNSSGIKAFLTWFLKAEGDRRHTYKIDLAYDPSRTWQSVSCGAMGRIARGVLRLVPTDSQ